MTVMRLLQRCRGAEREIRKIDSRIEAARAAAMRATAYFNPNSGGRSPMHDRLCDFVAKVDELEAEKAAHIEQYCNTLIVVGTLLDVLPERQRLIMTRHYLMGEKPTEYMKRLGYSYTHVKRLRQEGEQLLMAIPADKLREILPAWCFKKNDDE